MSCLWKQFPDEMLHHKTFAKKAPHFFWFQVGDLNISDIFYKIQNIKWWPVFPVITNSTYTCLSPWALRFESHLATSPNSVFSMTAAIATFDQIKYFSLTIEEINYCVFDRPTVSVNTKLSIEIFQNALNNWTACIFIYVLLQFFLVSFYLKFFSSGF